MPKGLLGIGFIFLVVFLLYKIVTIAFGRFRIHRYEKDTQNVHFPKEEPRSYAISQNDFARIAIRTAYRHKRIENAEVNNNSISLEFSSQTGFSKNHAVLTFVLSGSSIGHYTVKSDNPDSSIPNTIGDRIQNEIQNSAEIS